MRKIILAIGGLILVGSVIYLYFSPSIAFHKIRQTISSNDVDAFSREIDAKSIQIHFLNQMSLLTQDALNSYTAHPDPATVEARMAPYFKARSEALAAPAFLFRQLESQLKGPVTHLHTEFLDASNARISWTSSGKPHEALLSRHGISWKLSALDATDAMPKFWDQSANLYGTYHQASFSNCCVDGKATDMTYDQLELKTAIDILDVESESDPNWNMFNVTEAQLDVKRSALRTVKDGDKIEVHCKQLWQGDTGHYALPVYCDEGTIISVHADK